MGSAAQKKALTAYRERLARRGVSQFEVLGREDDRELIRSLAKHLADGGPEASEIRDAIGEPSSRTAREREGIWLRSGVRPWSGPSWLSRDLVSRAGKSPCDRLPARYEHHQRSHETRAVAGLARMARRTGRSATLRILPDDRRTSARRPFNAVGAKAKGAGGLFAGAEGPTRLFAGQSWRSKQTLQ